MCRYVEAAVRRYRGRIRRWQLTAASNSATLLSLGEDELLLLTVRMAEAARQVDPALEVIVGLAQPWGEYMAVEERNHSPFIFADTLIRSGLTLAALDVELVMGVTPRGSYCRDLLDTSRLAGHVRSARSAAARDARLSVVVGGRPAGRPRFSRRRRPLARRLLARSPGRLGA